MRWLSLDSDDPATRVPISTQSACIIELALLAPSPDSRRGQLESLLRQDPALTDWTCRCAAAEGDEAVKTCGGAAAWLTDRLPRILDAHWDDANLLAQVARPVETGGQSPEEQSHEGDVWRRLPLLVSKLCRLEQLEHEFEASLEREKIEALKELAYGAGHEVNNPLANISARAQTLIKDETDPQRRRKLAAINAQAYRAHEMIADLMLFARPPKLQCEPVDVRALIGQVIDSLSPVVEERAITIHNECTSPQLMASADRVQLGVVLTAICKNSIEALGVGGHIELSARETGTGAVEIVVHDDGPGISPEVRRHIFDPFYSGREAGRGLGFGLSKSWRIIREHGGQIEVHSQTGRGVTFTIQIPQAHAETSARAS